MKELEIGDFVHIKVKVASKHLFFPEFLQDIVGFVWGIDEEHVYIKSNAINDYGKSYMSGPHRYPWDCITLEKMQAL